MTHILRAGVVAALVALSASALAQRDVSGAETLMPPSLRAALQAAAGTPDYALVETAGAPIWSARNVAHRLGATFSDGAVSVGRLDEPDAPPALTLQLIGWGSRGSVQLPQPPHVVADGARIEYRRGPLVEWYLNGPQGVEQGFTIESVPAAADPGAPIELQIALGGTLTPELLADGDSLALRDADGVSRLAYSGPAAWDAAGRTLEAGLELSKGVVSILVEVKGACWPVTVDPFIWVQEATLNPPDPSISGYFGKATAISDDTVVIGSPGDSQGLGNASGAAYVFVRSGAAWIFQAKLKPLDLVTSDHFGTSVAISGDTIFVGAPDDDVGLGTDDGSVYVFERTGTSWSQTAKLTQVGKSGSAFGYSVGVEGDTAIVGIPSADSPGISNSGAAWVFNRQGSDWAVTASFQPVLSEAGVDDHFGSAVSISNGTIVIGVPFDDGAAINQGFVYIFTYSPGANWSLQARLEASDASQFSFFGASVSLDGDSLIVGATQADDKGKAYVYVRSGSTWNEQAKLTAYNGAIGDGFGNAVALSGDTAIVGAPQTNQGAFDVGSVYVFVRSGASWALKAAHLGDGAMLGGLPNYFGWAVAVWGDSAVYGSWGGGSQDFGTAYVWTVKYNEYAWTDLGFALAGSNGQPRFVGIGDLAAGSPGSLTLKGAKPSALCSLFVSIASTPAPFKGGTLVAFPPLMKFALLTSPTGTASLPFVWPAAVPSGASLWFQFLISDPGAIHGVALSNAVKATTP